MSNYPDNFSSTRAASFFGTDADDRRADRAAVIVEADVARAIMLRDAARAFLDAIEGIVFITRGPGGYDVEDAMDLAINLASFDLAAYRKEIERAAPDFVRDC